jgi:beta-mannosidase
MWAARAAWFVDEGLSGLAIVVANDEGTALDARLRLGLYLADGRAVEEVEIETLVNPFGQRRYSSEALLGSFFDTTQSYHFGPAAFDYARVVLERDGRAISQQLWFVKAAAVDSELAVCIREARVLDSERGDVAMVVESNRAARAVQIRVEGLQPTDNYFDLAGDDRRTVVLTGARDQTEVDCTIDALNLSTPYHARIRLDRSSDGGEQR